EDLKMPLYTVAETVQAIQQMKVRGAGLIGVTAGFGMYLATLEAYKQKISAFSFLETWGQQLIATRPTAVNLAWAVYRQLEHLKPITSLEERVKASKGMALQIAEEDVHACKKIGEYGVELIRQIAKKKQGPVHILTHCNAGWLAFVEYGTATSPIYQAFQEKIPVHVWVDETRPRCQGSSLTAWELHQQGIPHTIIVDNTGGHLMQHHRVDLVFTGADRVTRTGDVANKIGTYLKALAAQDNRVPFYVAFPSSTFDWEKRDGIREIPIEERCAEEVRWIEGLLPEGTLGKVQITPATSPVLNYGFDVTPARLITGLITERGICKADENSILKLFPEKSKMG
ncbi:MAG: S-methyl-5-thioribose-1-phosphate isomerase, partial [Planctomycetota bacterium]